MPQENDFEVSEKGFSQKFWMVSIEMMPVAIFLFFLHLFPFFNSGVTVAVFHPRSWENRSLNFSAKDLVQRCGRFGKR